MDIDDFPSQTEMEDLEAKSKKAETKIDVKKEDLKDQSTFVRWFFQKFKRSKVSWKLNGLYW